MKLEIEAVRRIMCLVSLDRGPNVFSKIATGEFLLRLALAKQAEEAPELRL